ncbi:hypothetical protein SAMN05444008_11760 [Cnuella takakiae]|uniref:Solute:sodium symporter small subunit n=1 Tax=Cnuella takakiae TaxID=1302690 RepID=A0A1M5GU09_9BACT|nr:hypothetical protein [Cnuella takakiae]OLY90885.1 hypothetical protein BUE76_02485 [Cnuella takakiae]SHG07264.1 hypothetical protein SAMN05444008_11760 [Cnuella takakiae]
MDPEVKKYFVKILNSFGMGLMWMFFIVTAGFYFKLALFGKSFQWYNGVFYVLALLTFALLIRYYVRLWSKDFFAVES